MRDELNPKALQIADATPIDVAITVNGRRHATASIDGDMLLIDYLHEELRLTGAKLSCGIGACGSCKVAVRASPDAPYMPVLSCYARMSSVNGMDVLTVEGVGTATDLHPLQRAFLEDHAFQCGYSTPGFVMAGVALIDQLQRRPIAEQDLERCVLEAIGGHVCRCTGYERYVQGICRVIRQMVDDGALRWAEAPEPAASSPITVIVRKRSRNDLSAKQLFCWFESPRISVAFERPRDLATLNATITLPFSDLRTGIQVRDLNVRRFLLSPYVEARFSLASAQHLDDARTLGASLGAGAMPVALEGTLELRGDATQRTELPIQCVALLSEVGDGRRLRVSSSAPIELDLAQLGLTVGGFAREFGLNLDAVVDVTFDLLVDLG